MAAVARVAASADRHPTCFANRFATQFRAYIRLRMRANGKIDVEHLQHLLTSIAFASRHLKDLLSERISPRRGRRKAELRPAGDEAHWYSHVALANCYLNILSSTYGADICP